MHTLPAKPKQSHTWAAFALVASVKSAMVQGASRTATPLYTFCLRESTKLLIYDSGNTTNCVASFTFQHVGRSSVLLTVCSNENLPGGSLGRNGTICWRRRHAGLSVGVYAGAGQVLHGESGGFQDAPHKFIALQQRQHTRQSTLRRGLCHAVSASTCYNAK